MPLGIDFWMDFDGFWMPKCSQVGTKMGSNIDFSENMKNAFGANPLVPNWVQEVQIGSKNRSRIDATMVSQKLPTWFPKVAPKESRTQRTRFQKPCQNKVQKNMKNMLMFSTLECGQSAFNSCNITDFRFWFWPPFGFHFGGVWEVKWRPRPSKS